jgi:hypothetical protein
VGDRVSFAQGDLFAGHLGEYSVVSLFLLPSANRWLEGKLQSELREGGAGGGPCLSDAELGACRQEEHDRQSIYLWVR